MDTQIQRPSEVPLTEILRDVTGSAKQLLVEQTRLLKTEFGATVREVGSDLRDLILFGALTILAALPFMMFLIFGLGDLLGGRYWLSSLIVAVTWGGGAGYLAFRQYQQLMKKNMTLAATREALDRSADAVKESVEEVKDAIGQTVQ